jgi:hypothetical protein
MTILALWLALCVARLSRLVESPELPPGETAAPTFDFFRAQVPLDAVYLYVLPTEFGADTGLGPRLRYELYPRRYDDVRASLDEPSVRAVVARLGVRYVLVPAAAEYPSEHWTRAPRDWLRRIELDRDRYVLEVLS